MKTMMIAVAALLIAMPALAEKGDAFKPLEIDADSSALDLVNSGAILTGNVVLTKGTILIKAGKATVLTDAEGYTSATFWAEPGRVVTFRQKRDGGNTWVEGEAERVEYSDKQEMVKFFNKAQVREVEGTRLLTQASGAYISYDARREEVAALNQPNGESKVGGGRIKLIIVPRRKPAPVPPTTPPAK